MELSATRAVVAEQASTERALLSEAAQTTASLGAAEEDVEELREKVARQVGCCLRWAASGWAGRAWVVCRKEEEFSPGGVVVGAGLGIGD